MKRTIFTLALVTLFASLGRADEELMRRTISVRGEGNASAPPDMATVQTGVVTSAVSAKEALEANNRAMEQVLKVLSQSNIAQRDIQTFGFHVHPEYRRQPGPRGGQDSNVISGYRVTNNVMVKVRNLPRLGEILDALVKAGSNNLSGVTFSIAEPRAIMDVARRNAMDDARGRAQLYAQAAGVALGKVVAISEQSMPEPGPMRARFAMAESSSVPIATGEQEVTATVNVMYEIAE